MAETLSYLTRHASGDQAVLVGVDSGPRPPWTAGESLEELGRLAGTAGVAVAERLIQRRGKPDPLTYVGKGKLEELRAELAQRPELTLVIFDDELSPGQQRNIGRILGDPPEALRGSAKPRLEGTAATVALSIANGADIVRVHDVKEMVKVARMCDAIVRDYHPDVK